MDGHRVNNNLTDGAFVDNAFLLDLDLVDWCGGHSLKIEVRCFYGNNAFFGVINVITRTGAQLNGFEVAGDYGLALTVTRPGLAMANCSANGIEMLLSASYYNSGVGNSELFYPQFDTAVSSKHKQR